MNALGAELRMLRWPLLRLALALIVATLLIGSALHFERQASAATAAVELAAARMRSQTQRLQNEEQDMRAKIAEYQSIAARGMIGPERRLNWVDLMRGIQRERQLLGLEYEIQPQSPWQGPEPRTGDSGHIFMSSAMRVQLPLLHEDDLLHFVRDLNADAPAFTRVRACRIARTEGTPAGAGLPPQLQADCHIEWITLQASGKAPK